ncbi:hypothetical protein RB195_018196 [Necator americanus]|uniref:UBC core domain-containing protein n=1 Tax=Necator americanus TaxID=51031 RepID=A0ABR1CA98_NECAM
MPVTPYIKQVQASRIKKEIAELSEKKNFVVSINKVGNKENYNVKFKSNHPLLSHAVMTVNFDLTGDYPFRPPNVRFAHQFYHPNVDNGGDICIPILCFDNWKPATTLENIMLSLLQLLGEPDLSRPIRFDVAEEYVKDPAKYKTNVAQCLAKIANGARSVERIPHVLQRNGVQIISKYNITTLEVFVIADILQLVEQQDLDQGKRAQSVCRAEKLRKRFAIQRRKMGGINWKDFCGGDLWHNPFPDGLPNLSVCFQHTVLVWVPVGFFWALFPFLVAQASLTSRKYSSLPWSPHLLLKISATTFITLVSVFIFLYTVFSSASFPPSDILYPLLWTVTFGCTTIAHVIRKRSGMVTSGILHLSAVAFAICGGPQFYQNVREGNDDRSYLSSSLCIAYYVWYSALIVYVLVMCFADPREPSEKTRRSAELDSSFFNRLTLWWFNPVPWKGAQKDLEPEDLFELNEGSTTKYLCDLWEQHWEPRMQDYRRKRQLHCKSLRNRAMFEVGIHLGYVIKEVLVLLTPKLEVLSWGYYVRLQPHVKLKQCVEMRYALKATPVYVF